MTVDLPTPPFPLAMAMVRVFEPGPNRLWTIWLRPLSLSVSASRSSHDMASSLISTVRPSAIAASACSASARIWLRSGQPAVVSTMVAPMLVVVDDDVADHVEVDHAAAQLRVLDGGQRPPDVFVGHENLRSLVVMPFDSTRSRWAAVGVSVSRARPDGCEVQRSVFKGSSHGARSMMTQNGCQSRS